MVGVGGGHDAALRSAGREGLWDGDFGVMLEMRQKSGSHHSVAGNRDGKCKGPEAWAA